MTNQNRLDLQWELLYRQHSGFCVGKHDRNSTPSLLREIAAEKQVNNPKFEQARDYHGQLLRMTDDELATEKVAMEKRLHAAYEARHIFNLPEALATDDVFEFWSRAELWSLAEAAALINARNPSFVNESRLTSAPRDADITVLLHNTFELLERARLAGTLRRNNNPINIINWLELKHMQMPQRLLELTLERGRTPYTVAAENQILRENLAAYEAKNGGRHSAEGADKQDKPLGVRERESLLKLVLGMAINGYSYDPKATRNKEVKEIANDLTDARLALDEDTVRKYLNEAKALFSDDLNRTE